MATRRGWIERLVPQTRHGWAQVVGVPVAVNVPLLHWRRERMKRLGVEEPHSWRDVVLAARAINGTDFNDGAATLCLRDAWPCRSC